MSQKADSRRPSAASSVRSSRDGSRTARSSQRSDAGREGSPSRASTSKSSPRTARGRHNKIYRCPPTPPPQQLRDMEKGFVLDNRAVSSISYDYSRTNPKLGAVIPPYNARNDRHTGHYYTFHGLDRTLKRTFSDVKPPHADKEKKEASGETIFCSIEGPVKDRFHTTGAGYQYLTLRNQFGAGHSRSEVDGHAQFMEGIKPVIGYNGKFGFRRNTPWLRQNPSPFGTTTLSSTY